jgi:hypothetical protein
VEDSGMKNADQRKTKLKLPLACLSSEDFRKHFGQANGSIYDEFRRKYQLENKLEFWRFELDSLLALPKQKINELKDEGLEALDPRIQPDVVEFWI